MKWLTRKQKGPKIQVDRRNRVLRRISLVSAVTFIAILLVFNILFDTVLGDHLRWDWSVGKMYSTGDVTRELLDDLDQEVQITGLFEPGSDSNLIRVERILEDYVTYGDGKVSVRYVDLDLVPSIKEELDPTGIEEFVPNSIVVKNMDTGKFRVISYQELFQIDLAAYYQSGQVFVTGLLAESAISGAIQYVTAEKSPTVYALTSHEEEDINDYTELVSILKNYNSVDLASLDLVVTPEIPEDCEMILMLDPKRDITADEQRVLSDFLQGGGDLMIVTEFNSVAFTRLNSLLEDFNIRITDNRVREDNAEYRYNRQPYSFIAETPANSAVSAGNTRMLAVNPREVRLVPDAREYIQTEVLLQTSDGAVLEQGGSETDVTEPGVQTLGVISENRGWQSSLVTETSRVAVVGSLDMLDDMILLGMNTGNNEMFFYTVNWLTDLEENSLFIAEKTLPTYRLQEGTQTSYIFAAATALVIVPGILLIVGLVVYRKRKNL